MPSLVHDASSSEYSGSSDCEVFLDSCSECDSDSWGVGDSPPPLHAPKRNRSSKSAAPAAPGWAAAVKELAVGDGGDSAAEKKKKKKKKKSQDVGAKTGTYVCGNLIPESLEGQLKSMSKEERSLVSHFVGESLPEPDTESDSYSTDGTDKDMMATLVGDKDASSDASSYGGVWSDSDCDDGKAGARSKPRSELPQPREWALIDAVSSVIAAQGIAAPKEPADFEQAVAKIKEALKGSDIEKSISQLSVGGFLDLLATRDTKDQDDIPGAKAGAKTGTKVGGATAMPTAKKVKAKKVKTKKTVLSDSDSPEFCASSSSGADSDDDSGDYISKVDFHASARRAELSAAKAKADAVTLASTRAAEKERKKQASAFAKAQAAEAEERAAREAAEKADQLMEKLIFEEQEARRKEDEALKKKEMAALHKQEKKEEKKRRKAEEAAYKLRQEEERKAQQERIDAEAEEARRAREGAERVRAEKEEQKRRKEAEKADKLRQYQELKANRLMEKLIFEEQEARRKEDEALKEKEMVALRKQEKKEEKKRRKAEEAAYKLRQEEERKAQQERIAAEAEEARLRQYQELKASHGQQAAEAAVMALVRKRSEAQAAEHDFQLRSQVLHDEQARILAEAQDAKRSRDVDGSERAREIANDNMHDAVNWEALVRRQSEAQAAAHDLQADLAARMEEENELEAGMDPRPASGRPLQVDAPPFQSKFDEDEALALRMQEEESVWFEKFGGMKLYASADNFSVASTVNSSSPAMDSRCAAVTPGFQDDVVHGIDEDNACIICWENPKEFCFNPCGHLVLSAP